MFCCLFQLLRSGCIDSWRVARNVERKDKILFPAYLRFSLVSRELQKRRRRRQIGRQKSSSFITQNNNVRASRFFVHFFCRPCTTTNWKCLIVSFMENVNKRWRISFSLSKLECGPQEISSREFAYTYHFQQINATKNSFSLVCCVTRRAHVVWELVSWGNWMNLHLNKILSLDEPTY